MNPSQPSGMATHDPGPIVLAMLEDMLWTIREQTLQIPQLPSVTVSVRMLWLPIVLLPSRPPWRSMSGIRRGPHWMGT